MFLIFLKEVFKDKNEAAARDLNLMKTEMVIENLTKICLNHDFYLQGEIVEYIAKRKDNESKNFLIEASDPRGILGGSEYDRCVETRPIFSMCSKALRAMIKSDDVKIRELGERRAVASLYQFPEIELLTKESEKSDLMRLQLESILENPEENEEVINMAIEIISEYKNPPIEILEGIPLKKEYTEGIRFNALDLLGKLNIIDGVIKKIHDNDIVNDENGRLLARATYYVDLAE